MGVWNPKANALFLEALELASSDERTTLLEAACGEDAALRAEVEALLRAHQEAGNFLEKPLLGDEGSLDGDPAFASDSDAPTVAESSDGDPAPLDFLEPCDVPGRLGKIGPYEVIEVIGHGGMGIVLRAFDPKLNRIVAVKVMAPKFAGNPTARKRFMREAQAVAAVSHPHVISVYAVDQTEKTPYLVMECVDAVSLEEKIDRCGHLEVKEILRIGAQIAAGLGAAHGHGLVHRDIKPSNILLEDGVERVKITDFGIARTVDDVAMTRLGEVVGSPQYMSPEQAQGKPVDGRSDLFSLGAVLYAMCTGRSPFRAESTVAVLRRVCDDVPRPIGEVNPDIPEDLAAIIDRLLAKDRADRFETAEEVSNLLVRYLAHLRDPATSPPPEPESIRPTGDRKIRDAGSSGGGRWQRRGLMIAAAVLLGLCFSVAATEATGVTHLAETILRIATGAGTLVVEVADPQVGITIDGEDLVISGAGPQEVRLKPGQYKIEAAKGGQVVRQELVTIERGGRRVVQVALEPSRMPLSWGGAVVPQTGVLASHEIRRFLGHAAGVQSVCVSPDGTQVLSGSDDGTVRLWDIHTGAELRCFEGSAKPVCSAAFLRDGKRLVSGSGNGTVHLWDAETGNELKKLKGHSGPVVFAVAVLPDGKHILSAGMDKTVRIWDIDSGAEVRKFELDRPICSAAVSGDGRRALCGDAVGDVQLWDLEEGRLVRCLEGPRCYIKGVAFSPDGRLGLSVGGVDAIRLWDLETGGEVHRFPSPGAVHKAVFSSDGSCVLTGGGSVMFVWDVKTGRKLRTFTAGYEFAAVAFTPDGAHAVSGSWRTDHLDNAVRLWELPYSAWPRATVAEQIEGLSGLLRARPPEAGLLARRALLSANLGRYDEAARDFAAALACEDTETRRRTVYESAVRDDRVFSRLLGLLPRDGQLRAARGQFLASRCDWQGALEQYRSFIESNGLNDATEEYARLLLLASRDEEYRKMCRGLDAHFGDTPAAAYVLVSLCTAGPQSGVDPAKVVRWAEGAVAASGDPLNFYALGAAHYRAGRYEQAVEVLEKTNVPGGQPIPMPFFLAMAYHRLGQWEKSWKAFDLGLRFLHDRAPPPDSDDPAGGTLLEWLHLNLMHREAKTVLALAEGPVPQTATAATSAVPVPLVLNEWVEVLPRIDQACLLRGTWERRGDALVCHPETGSGLVEFPVAIGGNYDLQLDFTLDSGETAPGFALPVGAKQCSVLFNSHHKRIDGIQPIAGQGIVQAIDGEVEIDHRNPTARESPPFEAGRHGVVVEVRVEGDSASIDVLRDGKPHLQWKGRQAFLSEPPVSIEYFTFHANRPGLVLFGGTISLDRVRIRLVSK